MRTKVSLKFERDEASEQQFHLYNEVFDDDHVYLELVGFPFEAASSIVLSGQGPGGGQASQRVGAEAGPAGCQGMDG